MDEMGNGNERKTYIPYESVWTTYLLTLMSPKALGYEETEIYIIKN